MSERLFHRRSIRLKGYRYSGDGGYFVTICTHLRAALLGEVVDGAVRCTPFGDVAAMEWERTPSLRRGVHLDEYVIMPNHLHGILVFANGGAPAPVRPVDSGTERMRSAPTGAEDAPRFQSPSATLGAIVRGFKAASTRNINMLRGMPSNEPVWQRNYYEHIIRDHDDLERIREYIVTNPARWAEDADNPANVGRGQSADRKAPGR